MAETVRSVAILFVDICDSTELFEVEGDDLATRMIDECLTVMTRCTTAEGGRVVKTTGDGVLSTFPNAEAALMAALAMQNAEINKSLSVRAGLHVGRVIDDRRDIYGDAVNVAARVASFARPGEILFTKDTKQNLSAGLRSGACLIDRTTVKGKKQPIDIFGLASLETDSTLMSGVEPEPDEQGYSLVLAYRKRGAVLDQRSGSFALGRDPGCDLVVDGEYASRQHAAIEFKRGKFYLVDHSTNGTYVLFEDHRPVFLKRELLQLLGKGFLSLGRFPVRDRSSLIRFQLRS